MKWPPELKSQFIGKAVEVYEREIEIEVVLKVSVKCDLENSQAPAMRQSDKSFRLTWRGGVDA